VLDIWNEVDACLTSTPTPNQIPAFRPSQAAQDRLRHLLAVNHSRPLIGDVEVEPRETLAVDQFMRRLKIRAIAKAQK
jgi:hypothetical protein